MPKFIYTFFLAMILSISASAQEEGGIENDRATTGGAQTLDDIMARQRGISVDDAFRRESNGANAQGAELE